MSIRIGIDFGNVLTNKGHHDKRSTAFVAGDYLATPIMDGAFDAVGQLVQRAGPDNAFIISKCREVTEQNIRDWLTAKNFYNHTGFNPVNVYFCREHAEKAPLAQQLGLTHFVDDRADILLSMHQIVPHRYLFGPQDQPMMFDDGLVRVLTWDETLTAIYRTF